MKGDPRMTERTIPICATGLGASKQLDQRQHQRDAASGRKERYGTETDRFPDSFGCSLKELPILSEILYINFSFNLT